SRGLCAGRVSTFNKRRGLATDEHRSIRMEKNEASLSVCICVHLWLNSDWLLTKKAKHAAGSGERAAGALGIAVAADVGGGGDEADRQSRRLDEASADQRSAPSG